jgi:hypothetical protein
MGRALHKTWAMGRNIPMPSTPNRAGQRMTSTRTYLAALVIVTGAVLISGQYDVVLLPISNYGTE